MKYMIIRIIRFYDMEQIVCVQFIIKYKINLSILKGKGKVTPETGLRGLEVKAPGFLDNRHTKVVRLSALRTGRL
jgi:hypothetical protein